jgi:hypothetical protein
MILSRIFVHIFHILIVGSLFLYVGINGIKTPAFVFPLLMYLGIVIIIYHSYKVYKRLILDKSAWFNYIHIFLIGPLLITIGLNGVNTSRKYFELLLMSGMASIGYHGYYLILIFNKLKKNILR